MTTYNRTNVIKVTTWMCGHGQHHRTRSLALRCEKCKKLNARKRMYDRTSLKDSQSLNACLRLLQKEKVRSVAATFGTSEYQIVKHVRKLIYALKLELRVSDRGIVRNANTVSEDDILDRFAEWRNGTPVSSKVNK